MDASVYNWFVLPSLIFLARVADVSIGTLRIVLFSKNKKFLVTALAFVEVLIWLLAIRQIFVNLANPICYIAFAAGFATGNYVGLWLEEKIALGFVIIRIITGKPAEELVESLSLQGYGVTLVPAKGTTGDVSVIFTIIRRSEINKAIGLIKEYNSKAFYTIEDVKAVGDNAISLRQAYRHMFFSKKRK